MLRVEQEGIDDLAKNLLGFKKPSTKLSPQGSYDDEQNALIFIVKWIFPYFIRIIWLGNGSLEFRFPGNFFYVKNSRNHSTNTDNPILVSSLDWLFNLEILQQLRQNWRPPKRKRLDWDWLPAMPLKPTAVKPSWWRAVLRRSLQWPSHSKTPPSLGTEMASCGQE